MKPIMKNPIATALEICRNSMVTGTAQLVYEKGDVQECGELSCVGQLFWGAEQGMWSRVVLLP